MIGDRLKEVREAAGLSQEEFGKLADTSKQYVSQLERGINRNPAPEFLRLWARKLRVRMEWLTSGELPKDAAEIDDDWSDVRGYTQSAGLGNGHEASDHVETHNLKFRRRSLDRKRLRPDQLAVVYGRGDSMLPRIHDGDAIMFDTTDTSPADDKRFVIQCPGAKNHELQVKRCEIIDDIVYFRADNPEGDHNWRKPRRKDDPKRPIEILGRVRWIGSWED